LPSPAPSERSVRWRQIGPQTWERREAWASALATSTGWTRRAAFWPRSRLTAGST